MGISVGVKGAHGSLKGRLVQLVPSRLGSVENVRLVQIACAIPIKLVELLLSLHKVAMQADKLIHPNLATVVSVIQPDQVAANRQAKVQVAECKGTLQLVHGDLA